MRDRERLDGEWGGGGGGWEMEASLFLSDTAVSMFVESNTSRSALCCFGGSFRE